MNNSKITVVNRAHLNTMVNCLAFMVCLALGMNAAAQPPARMGISPDRYMITFDERGGDTQSLMIHNLSREPMTVNLTVSNWDLDENNRVRVIGPTERSLDQWIVLNPLSVTIPPGSPQTVRWAVMPRLQPDEGEYRALIFIEEGENPNRQGGEGANIRMKMRYGLPIYAQVGERIQSAQLNDINIDRDINRVFLDITNTGNSHGRMSGNFGIWRAAEFPGSEAAIKQLRAVSDTDPSPESFLLSKMPGTVILPENRRSVALNVSLDQPGDYVLQLNGEMAGLQITDTIQFTQTGR